MIRLRAHAKVNLALEVLGRRPDGFHELATVLQTVDLHDRLTLEPGPTLSLTCSPSDLEGEQNLALRAGHLLREAYGIREGARIRLEKGIPVASGLGGGSADGAGTLVGLARLWGLDLDRGALHPLAERLGSDVPFFLYGGTALAEGRGERITPLPPAHPLWFVVVVPPIRVPPDKTARVFARVDPRHCSDGSRVRELVRRLRRGDPPAPELLGNTLEEAAREVFPALEGYRQALLRAGASAVHLSGAGPSLFALVSGPEEGWEVLEGLHRQNVAGMLLHSVPEGVVEETGQGPWPP